MKKIPLLLLCLWAQMAWAQEPVQMDSTQIKLLVRLACPCFKDMAQIFPEKITDEQTLADFDEKIRDNMRQNFQCALEGIRNHKKELGMEHVPDSLLEVGETAGARPPACLRNIPMNSILYAVRDCPYLFKGMKAALDFAQIMQKKQAERWTAAQKDSVITEEPPVEPEFYDNGYQKRFKGKLKGMESKNMPTLVIERMIDGKKGIPFVCVFFNKVKKLMWR